MQLSSAALLGLAALLPHALAASLHHAYSRDHAGLAARLPHERAAAPAADAAPKLRKRKTCTRRASSSLSVTATATAVSSSAATTAVSSVVSASESSSSAETPKPSTTSTATSTSSATPKPPPPTATSSAVAPPPTTSAHSSGGGGGAPPLTPNGNKAGIAGGDSYDFLQDHIGWWYDWTPNPHKPGKPVAVSMLWGGGGSSDPVDSGRVAKFAAQAAGAYPYILGFEEPDCPAGGGSAGMSVSTAAQVWNQYIAPKKNAGTLIASPSMCHQAAETFLTPFEAQINTPWDITNIHINKNSMDGVKKDIDYYYNKYQKPLWVSEFACVDDSTGFVPCTDQGEINNYIAQIVDLFEADDRVHAYAYSDGEGLGDVWPTVKNGQLSASGQAYLNALKKYH